MESIPDVEGQHCSSGGTPINVADPPFIVHQAPAECLQPGEGVLAPLGQITSDLAEISVETPSFADRQGRFATICTKAYVYGANAKNKLSYIKKNFRTENESRYLASVKARYLAPKSQMNTNAALTLAKQWLKAASMDVTAMERDCRVEIQAWELGGQYVPLYRVQWLKGEEEVVATVEVLEPEGLLQKLWVEKAEYVERDPLAVPNREKLLQVTSGAP